MLGQRFRLKAPKLGLVLQDGRKIAVQIPAGAEILAIDSVPDPVVDPQQQVHVTWEGNAKSETVINSLVAKLEALEGELTVARNVVQKVSKSASVKVDPVAASLKVKKDFEGFGELPVSEQKPLLQKYILRLDYVEPQCTGDISAMFDVTMQINTLQHSKPETPS